MNYYLILTAFFICILIFLISHLLWIWRVRRHGKNVMPIFWERLVFLLVILFASTRFFPLVAEDFALWLVLFYLIFLGIHTSFIYKRFQK